MCNADITPSDSVVEFSYPIVEECPAPLIKVENPGPHGNNNNELFKHILFINYLFIS